MTTLILIDEDCSIKQQKTRVSRDTLYKKCGFKNSDGFKLQHKWIVESNNIHIIELWAKDVGVTENENNYTLPYPLNDNVYYGTFALIAVNDKDSIISMNIEKWKKIYDILNEDNDTQPDDDTDSISVKDTNCEYLKDEYNCGEDSNEEEDDNDDKATVRKPLSESELDDDELIDQIHCGSELEEEEYVYSDNE